MGTPENGVSRRLTWSNVISVGCQKDDTPPVPWPFNRRTRCTIDCSDPGGIRTHDLRIKSPLLYQLSYRVPEEPSSTLRPRI